MRKINIDDKKTAKVLLWLFVLADVVIPAALTGIFLYFAFKDGVIR